MSKYFDHVRPSYLESWPAALHRLSIAYVDIPLSLEEARAIGTNMMEYAFSFAILTPEQQEQQKRVTDFDIMAFNATLDGKPLPEGRPESPSIDFKMEDVSGIRSRVRDAVAQFPQGVFIRLGSRSPKDSWAFCRQEKPGRILATDTDPLRFILDASERMHDDLLLALQNDYTPHIFVRQWLDIPAWTEFRCFMQARKLVGISQYLYRDHFPLAAKHASIIEWGITEFFRRSFRDACHLDDVVFDVFALIKSRGNECEIEVKLLEINPFGPMTDPCLFRWKAGDMDGSFRLVHERKKTSLEEEVDPCPITIEKKPSSSVSFEHS